MKASVSTPRVSVARDVYFSPATQEGCIVLNLERGSVLSLNGTGALLFSKLAEARGGLTRAEFIEILRREFGGVVAVPVRFAVGAARQHLPRRQRAHRDVAARIGR